MALIGILNTLYNKIIDWKEVSKQRRELMNLSDYLLKDIGISRIDADREAQRNFWDVAPNCDTGLRINQKRSQKQFSEKGILRCCQASGTFKGDTHF